MLLRAIPTWNVKRGTQLQSPHMEFVFNPGDVVLFLRFLSEDDQFLLYGSVQWSNVEDNKKYYAVVLHKEKIVVVWYNDFEHVPAL